AVSVPIVGGGVDGARGRASAWRLWAVGPGARAGDEREPMSAEPHDPTSARVHRWSWGTAGLWVVRYGIGAAMVIAGIVLLVSSSQFGVDGFAMAVGGGLAVLMINVLFRF